ncbi:zona pellucida sperm-binding protein 3-like isoform 2-T2 [Spinachia spinachia]
MEFKEGVLLGFMLLLLGGAPRAATQSWPGVSVDDAPNRILEEREEATAQLPRAGRGSNRTEAGAPVRPLLTYQLRVHQLGNPAVTKQPPPSHLEAQMHAARDPQTPEPRAPNPQQPLVKPQELLKLIPGPDLNPSVKPVWTQTFEQRVPVPPSSVAARCGPREVNVEVKRNFLGNGQLIRPSDLTLGGCAALDSDHHILRFLSELHGCSSAIRMTEEDLIYSFSLLYDPAPIDDTFIFKTNPTEVVIECHYQRRLYVSSGAMMPTWKPFVTSTLAEQKLHFSVRLMTEDWQSQRPSGDYLLSDVVNIEVAVDQGHHVPLRVFADSCVATMSPDPNSQPRYSFINNHGCLSDAEVTGAKSYFMPRSREDRLHFQLKAFRFHNNQRNSVYITCNLKATQLSKPIDPQHKACSYLTEARRWVASGGDNKVCSCCETSCGVHRQKRSLAGAVEPQWEGVAALGPIQMEESILLEELAEDKVTPAWCPSAALLCAVSVSIAALLLLALIGAVVRGGHHKLTGHFVCT